MIEISAINHVSLLVSDTVRALGFYQGVLGMKLNTTRPDMDYPGAWLDVGAAQIHLLELPVTTGEMSAAGHGGRDRHFAMDVADLEAVEIALDAAGIEYTLSRSGRRALFCRDPDGNAIELIEFSSSQG